MTLPTAHPFKSCTFFSDVKDYISKRVNIVIQWGKLFYKISGSKKSEDFTKPLY